MRLCWVNVDRVYRTPQLPRVYLPNVNQEHTRVNTHTGRVYINSRSSFHLWPAPERTCADTLMNLLIVHIHPSQPHLPLTSELTHASSGPFKIKHKCQIENWEDSRILHGEAIKWARQQAEENRSTCTHGALGGSADKSLSQVCKQIVLILLL